MKNMWALVSASTVLAIAVYTQADSGSCNSQAAGGSCSAQAACAKTTPVSTSDTACCAAGTANCSAGACASGTCSTVAKCSEGGCPIAAAMEHLPKVTYAVGDKKVCCPQEAASLAKDSGKSIRYHVADKSFESEGEAQAALLEATEQFVAAFTKPHTCPQSGQVTLAGQAQSCEASAAQTAERMQKAMTEVKLTYRVGDKDCGCPVEAGKAASESGAQMLYVVGDQATPCEKTARLNLARAKYRAAVEAMVKAQSPAPQTESATGA